MAPKAKSFRLMGRVLFATFLSISTLGAHPPQTFQAKQTPDRASTSIEKNTSIHQLKSGLPVVLVYQPSSDIVLARLYFDVTHVTSLNADAALFTDWFWRTLPIDTTKFSRDTFASLIEEHEVELKCHDARPDLGTIFAGCSIETVRPFWKVGLSILGAVITSPGFPKKESSLKKANVVWEYKVNKDQVGTFSRDLVANELFFPKEHPFHSKGAQSIEDVSERDLASFHKKLLQEAPRFLIVIAPLTFKDLLPELEANFGSLQNPIHKETISVAIPKFDRTRSYIFSPSRQKNVRITALFNAPGMYDSDRLLAEFTLFILQRMFVSLSMPSKELEGNYVSTFERPGIIGIGEMFIRANSPELVFKLLNTTFTTIKETALSSDALNQHKAAFADEALAYEKMPPHVLIEKLSYFFAYHKKIAPFFEERTSLEAFKPEDIQRISRKMFVNFRTEVIGDRSKFNDIWATQFINQHLSP